MIRLLQLGGASVTVPYKPYTNINDPYVYETPQYFANLPVTRDIPVGTLLFSAFSTVWPNRYTDYDPTQLRFLTELVPVFDSKGNAWTRSGSLVSNTHRGHFYQCVTTTKLVANVDTITACLHAALEDPGESYHYGYRLTQVLGMLVFGFQCLDSVVDDPALCGFGEEWIFATRRPQQNIDVTPLGGIPYSPRLQIVFLGTQAAYNPLPRDPFSGGQVTVPEGVLPTAGFLIPPTGAPNWATDWVSVGAVSAEVHGLHFPVAGDPPAPPPIVSPVDSYATDALYYRFVPEDTIEDTIILPGIDFGTGSSFYVHRGLFTYRCREIPCPTPGGPDSVHSLHGDYWVATETANERIRIRRAPLGRLPFDLDLEVTPVGSGDPSLAWNPAGESLHLLFTTVSGSVAEIYSRDRGATWSQPEERFASGMFPCIRIDQHAWVVRAVWTEAAPAQGWGLIQVTHQSPGDAAPTVPVSMEDETGLPLYWEPTGFTLSPAPDGPERWLLTATLANETADSQWLSTDRCLTVKRIV